MDGTSSKQARQDQGKVSQTHATNGFVIPVILRRNQPHEFMRHSGRVQLLQPTTQWLGTWRTSKFQVSTGLIITFLLAVPANNFNDFISFLIKK